MTLSKGLSGFQGGALVRCAAGFLNVPKIKARLAEG